MNKLGYRLIHIWEDEWNNDKDKVKEKLEKVLNNTEEIVANNKELILDRCWYSKSTVIDGFKLVKSINEICYAIIEYGW